MTDVNMWRSIFLSPLSLPVSVFLVSLVFVLCRTRVSEQKQPKTTNLWGVVSKRAKKTEKKKKGSVLKKP